MTASTTSNQPRERAEPLPGYTLIRRIGVGGNSEVWEASGVNADRVAVKFVHGGIDEKRAVRELTSLNRVLALRHPSLLEVKRVEVVEGQLLILTEVADGSLDDRFEACCQHGNVGIPRDELLEYMIQTADALDYLLEQHSLQHLDVKPGNLLLKEGRIKVGDFGLLKDLQDNKQSLIHGLTPKYAAPELFDGRPGSRSDQYSLAIVYQAMLTGKLPFDGTTPAQLASQHLHGTPDLGTLSPLERFAVGKALSKQPAQRFRSCREFVDRLMYQGTATMITGGTLTLPGGTVTRHKTDAAELLERKHDGHTVVVSAPEITSLPALQMESKDRTFRPVIFIGIGGTGGQTLSRLKRLMSDRLGDMSEIPAVRFLYLDTDIDSINAAMDAKGGMLSESETLVLPLRSTEEYRSGKLVGLESLSRRWLYNIPRSQRTDGLRALGRLALLDYAERVTERLREAAFAVTDSNSVTAANESLAADMFRETDPQVYVVAAAGGGTGSGMFVDMGYAVRQALAEAGLSDEHVCGILTYSTARGTRGLDLAPVNTAACLSELRHFANPMNDYPGELSRGLAGFRENAPTYKSTYLVDFGDDQTDQQYQDAVKRLAEYLFLSSTSPASAALETCRQHEQPISAESTLPIRTLGIAQYGAATESVPAFWIESVARGVLRKWRGGVNASRDDDRIKVSDFERLLESTEQQHSAHTFVETHARQIIERTQLTLETLALRSHEVIEQLLGKERDEYFTALITETLLKTQQGSGSLEERVEDTIRVVRAIIGLERDLQSESLTDSHIDDLRNAATPQLREHGGRLGAELKRAVLALVDDESARVDGAKRVEQLLARHVKRLEHEVVQQQRSIAEQLESLQTQIDTLSRERRRRRSKVSQPVKDRISEYSQLLLDKLVCELQLIAINSIDSALTASSDQLRDLWKELNQLVDVFGVSSRGLTGGELGDEAACSGQDCVERLRDEYRDALTRKVDRQIGARLQLAEYSLCELLTQDSGRKQLVADLRRTTREVILTAEKSSKFVYLQEVLARGEVHEISSALQECLHNATPQLVTSGGAKRLIVAMSGDLLTGPLAGELERLSGDQVTSIGDDNVNLVVCYEVEQLSQEGIETRLIRRRPDCIDMARRVHTRVDVAWLD